MKNNRTHICDLVIDRRLISLVYKSYVNYLISDISCQMFTILLGYLYYVLIVCIMNIYICVCVCGMYCVRIYNTYEIKINIIIINDIF